MFTNQNSPLATDDGYQSKGFRNSRQSLSPSPVLIDLSLPADHSPLLSKNYSQISSFDEDDFELPSCEIFDEDMNAGRVQVLISFLQFDIDDATAHVDRVNHAVNEPMLFGELRRRLDDMNRLNEEITAAFSELISMRITAEESRIIHQLFQQHTINYWSARKNYESLIQEARGVKKPFRIDFRDFRLKNFPPKLTRSLCSGDIALLPINLEQSVPFATVTSPKLVHPSSMSDVKKVLISGPIGIPDFQAKLSQPPQLPSSRLICSNSPQQIEHVSANAISSETRFRTLSSDRSTIASPAAARIQTIETKIVQEPAIAGPRLARFPLHATHPSSKFEQQMTNKNSVDIQLRSENDFLKSEKFSCSNITSSLSDSLIVLASNHLAPQIHSNSILGSIGMPSSPPEKSSSSVTPLLMMSQSVSPEEVQVLPSESLETSSTSSPFLNSEKCESQNGQGSANVSSTAAQFGTPSSRHHAIASPEVSRILMISKQIVQRPANAISSRFHLRTMPSELQTIVSTKTNTSKSIPSEDSVDAISKQSLLEMFSIPTVQRPANESSTAAQFHLHASTLLINSRFLRLKKGSVNASPSMARFPTSPVYHSANASPEESRFRMLSNYSMQRPANVSPTAAPFHLHLSPLSLLLCQPQSNSSTNCNKADFQVLFLPDKNVMSRIISFVFDAHHHPRTLLNELQSITRKKTTQNEAVEPFVTFLGKGKIRSPLVNHEKVFRRFHNEENHLKCFNFNATYDNIITAGRMIAISVHFENHIFTLRLAVPFLLATNTQLFVACKSANRFLEAARKTATFSINDHQQEKQKHHEIRPSLNNIQFYVRKLFDCLEKFPSKLGTTATANIFIKTFIGWYFVTWLFHFVVKAFNKANLMSRISNLLDLQRIGTFNANFLIERSKQIQAFSLISKCCESPSEQPVISVNEFHVEVSRSRLVLKTIKEFRSSIFVTAWIHSMLTLFVISGKTSKKIIHAKTRVSFVEKTERCNHRHTSYAHLLVVCELFKMLRKIGANCLNRIQPLFLKIISVAHQANSVFVTKTVKQGLKKHRLASSISPFVS